MEQFTQQQIKDTLKLIESSIVSSEKVQPKLKEGTASVTNKKNRIKALDKAKELEKAVIQITSI